MLSTEKAVSVPRDCQQQDVINSWVKNENVAALGGEIYVRGSITTPTRAMCDLRRCVGNGVCPLVVIPSRTLHADDRDRDRWDVAKPLPAKQVDGFIPGFTRYLVATEFVVAI